MGLLEMSVSGAVVILAVVLIRTVAINYLPKKTFLVLWGIVLLRLLVPLRISSKISVYSWMPQQMKNASATIESQLNPSQKYANKSDAVVPGQNQTDRNQNQNKENRLDDTKIPAYRLVWAAGCILCLLHFTFLYIKCRLNFRNSSPVEDNFCHKFLIEQGMGSNIQVRQSGTIKGPLTYGLFHPVILMPENTEWENTKQMQYVLRHECIHIRRLDTVTKIVLIIALSVHWFNPFVWAMYVLCNRDLELSCDEMVVHAFGESSKAEYARILIDLEEKRRQQMPLCSGFSKNAMEERIIAIMKIKRRTAASVMAAAVLVCVVAGIFITSAAAAKQQKPASVLKHTENRGKAAGAENRKITNISLNLSNDQAKTISDAVCAHMESEYKGVYSFQNYEFRFCKESVKGSLMSLDIDASANMMLIRSPKKSPFAKGMLKAIKEIKSAKKKKAARKLYDDYLKEAMQAYLEPEETGFSYLVQIPLAAVLGESDFEFELFYRSSVDGEILGSFADEKGLDEDSYEEAGESYIKENL